MHFDKQCLAVLINNEKAFTGDINSTFYCITTNALFLFSAFKVVSMYCDSSPN